MAYLELGETGPKQTKINISSPCFTKNSECQIQKTFEFFQNGEEWKTHTGIPFLLKEIRTNTIELEINSAEDFDFWNGSLLKITIACEGNRCMSGNEERCVLFKVERYDEIVIPVARVAIRKDNDNKLMDFDILGFGKNLVSKDRDNTRASAWFRRRRRKSPPTTQSTTQSTTRHTTRSTTRPSTTRLSTTQSTTRPPTTQSTTRPPTTRSTTQPPSTQSIRRPPTTRSTTQPPITRSTTRPPTIRSTTQPRGPTRAVRTTLTSQSPPPTTSTTENSKKVALALALGYLVYHRRRKRTQLPQNNYNDLGVMNNSKDIYEDPDRSYETLKEDRNEVSPSQPGISSDTYSYPDSNIIPNPTSSEQEYTYAKDTDFHKSSVNTKATSEKPISNGVVYQTLEQPEQPTVDDFYNYPDNTNTAKPSVSSEQEYTYAKDTDVPRDNPNTKVSTQYPANRAVYHTLEQPEQPSDDDFYHYPDNTNITKTPSSELEYTYAKDTDFPRGNTNTKVTTQDPANRAVHHTLEQPEQPSDDDFYHYPDNTNITKPPSSELEYTYAKDTEIPKSFVNTKTVPKGDSSPAATDALYDTPGSEYSYVKNTDILSIPLGTEQTTNEHSSPLPDNSGLYHTLEEPNSPQAPVYSTLEGPEDVENHKQVNDEGLNFSDHTYIDVIGASNTTDSRN
ncbi:Hypothetical predicted protein [Paramuricea clavata]|uniref:Uncharacterized protein n=1 Tax=Paramuricea clavata TaxID=317549 RepID=A0A6S7H1S7_PARCT|nr:Hypothetical predicted protein [Paramuricea clavata]